MKNVLSISAAGQDLLYSSDDGTNRLIINGTEIASSSWVGTGTYTTTVEGHTVTITKAASLTGNLMLAETGSYAYEFRSFTETQPVTGVKGNSESAYRTGNVNLTAANIGANQKVTGMSADGETTSVASGTTPVDLLTDGITLTANHKYLLIYLVQWAANATGRRFTGVYLTPSGESVGIIAQDQRPAVSGAITFNRAEVWFQPGSGRTYMIKGFQDSGSTLSAVVRYQLIDYGT